MAELSDPVFAYRPPGGNAYGPRSDPGRDIKSLDDQLAVTLGQMQGANDSADERFKRGNKPPPIAPDDFRGA